MQDWSCLDIHAHSTQNLLSTNVSVTIQIPEKYEVCKIIHHLSFPPELLSHASCGIVSNLIFHCIVPTIVPTTLW